jgi:hypothetical protein
MEMANVQQRGLERMINFLIDEMEMTSGVNLGGPRFPEPPSPVIQNSPTNVTHNITIDRSVVGAVNSGTIQNLNQSMNNISNNLNDNYAKIIKLVVEKILALNSINMDQKQEFTEKVAFLTEQLAVPEANRKRTLIKDTLDWISRILAGNEAAIKVWLLAKTLFDTLLS